MTPRIVAIVPAAGQSRRMGQPKLLLRLGEQTVISRVVETLRKSGIEKIVIVVRPDDEPLAEEVRRIAADLIQPAVAPPEMRASVEVALESLMKESNAWDGWMLIPADHPTLDADSIVQLMAAWAENPSKIAVPTWKGRRGHPTLFPWSTAVEVSQVPLSSGLNSLLRSQPDRVREIPSSSAEVLIDLDTPDDWARISERWGGQ